MEIWKSIINWDGYEVSNYGQVRSYRQTSSRGFAKEPRLLTVGISVWGYPEVRFSNNKISKKFRVHRLVAETFIENKDFKKEVNHKDGNKLNNHIDNLEWVSRSENMVHLFQVSKCPTMCGEKNGQSKLTSIEVIEIREKWNTGNFLQKELGNIYGVKRSTINAIVNNYNWSKVA